MPIPTMLGLKDKLTHILTTFHTLNPKKRKSSENHFEFCEIDVIGTLAGLPVQMWPMFEHADA